MKNENYNSRTSQLFKDFKKTTARAMPKIISRFGDEKAKIFIQEALREYEKLIPQIPYIGEKNPFQIFLFPTSRYLAIYRILQKNSLKIEDAGRFIIEISNAEINAIPVFMRRLIRTIWFSKWFMGRLRKRAAESNERKYPEDYVFTFVESPGKEFNYGIDYFECASCKFLTAQNAFELAPYICAVDKTASEKLGWGLTRTMTLAEKSEKCDFRFKKGGKTNVSIPKSLLNTEK